VIRHKPDDSCKQSARSFFQEVLEFAPTFSIRCLKASTSEKSSFRSSLLVLRNKQLPRFTFSVVVLISVCSFCFGFAIFVRLIFDLSFNFKLSTKKVSYFIFTGKCLSNRKVMHCPISFQEHVNHKEKVLK